jgi:hypothetical protein
MKPEGCSGVNSQSVPRNSDPSRNPRRRSVPPPSSTMIPTHQKRDWSVWNQWPALLTCIPALLLIKAIVDYIYP